MRTFLITLPHDGSARFCRAHHIRWPALFGSVPRDDFRSGATT
jgi:hypothetical protein